MVLGVFLTFRVLDFPDLTVDGSLPLGAAVTARAHRPRPLAVAGHRRRRGRRHRAPACVTGLLHILLKSGESDANNYGPKLLAGILTMTGLYTVNLRIMGRSNIPLLGVQVVFDKVGALLSIAMVGWNLVARAGGAGARRQVPPRLVPAHRVRPRACRPPATTSR